MNAFKCDCCGKFFESKNYRVPMQINIFKEKGVCQSIDVCSGCAEIIKDKIMMLRHNNFLPSCIEEEYEEEIF